MPLEWMARDVKTYIDDEIDIVFKTRDHFPLLLETTLSQDAEADIVRRRTAIISRSAILDPVKRAGFESDLQWCPRPLWNEHNHDTQKQVFEYIRETAKQWFPIEAAAQRKPYMAEDTWQATLGKKGTRKHVDVLENSFCAFSRQWLLPS